MLEVLIWSLFVGSLGIDAVVLGGWLRWQETVNKTQEEEEEEILSNHESHDRLTGEKISRMTSVPEAKRLPLGESGKRLNRLSSSSVQNPSPTPASRKSLKTRSPNIPTQGKQSDSYRSPAPLGFNESPSNSANLEPESLTDSHQAVDSFHHPQTMEQPMYFTEPPTPEWEYKIVRAHYDFFRNPQNFMRLCEEESQAGWILLEKLDDRRVRFKRNLEMRDNIDVNQLSFDPYRCHYGPSNGLINFMGAIAAMTAMVLPAYLGYTLVSHTLQESAPKNSQTQAPLELIDPTFQPPQIP
jgi:hypothetical protein